jgi:hypothetical protein
MVNSVRPSRLIAFTLASGTLMIAREILTAPA